MPWRAAVQRALGMSFQEQGTVLSWVRDPASAIGVCTQQRNAREPGFLPGMRIMRWRGYSSSSARTQRRRMGHLKVQIRVVDLT